METQASLETTVGGADPDRLVEQWYAEHSAALERYVRSMVRDPEEAADVCQESFVRLLVVTRAGQLPDSAGAWLHRVAHNLVVSNARRRQTSDRFIDRLADRDSLPSTEESIVGRERDRTIVEALTDAPVADRTAMLLAAQGYRAREIGQRLGRSEPAARTLLCRARGRLRERMLAFEPA
jgi:RNA polymerase sigma-70 factor (ECF subfamily)